MSMREARTLARDIEATAIPYGEKVPLKAGSTLFVMQALGGSFTGMSDQGYMVRIEGQDADAIGEEVQAGPSLDDLQNKPLVDLVWDQLRTCYDPEIPVNIVDLGLVYSCDVAPLEEGSKVSVRFSLTAPGCGMGDILKKDIEQKVTALPGVREADVQIAFDPPWDQSRMSEAARLQLGLM
ncbi:MAG TPA: putative Fe-S cluster assembly protein SufT [Vicinamibacteria bacterium]|nr:putative Fe-S cluster assembly protein SufT [Vicinamibacteria bacterium]